MKKSEFKSYLKETIFEILSEDAQKAEDQKAYNAELEKTKQHHKDLGITEEEIAEALSLLNENEDVPTEYVEIAKLYLTSKGHDSKVVPELTLKAMGRIIIDKFYNGDVEKAYSDLTSDSKETSEKAKGLMKENISQEVINKVSRFVTSLANYYDYSEQDAVYAIMQALRAHGAGFEGLNEEEMDDEEMDKQASSSAKKGDSISKAASKLSEITKEMKSVVSKYKKSEEPEKSKHLARLKELTKIKKELEALL